MSRGVVRDDLMGNFLLSQFPGCQRGPLAPRPGLIAIHLKFFAFSLRCVHWSGGTADIHESEPSRVTMGQKVTSVSDQLCAVAPNIGAMPDVFIRKFFRLSQR